MIGWLIIEEYFFLLQYLDCLWAQIQKLKKDRWQEKHILRPYLAFDSVLCEALQHNLPPFTPPPHTKDSIYPVPLVVFRMFDYTDAPEVCSSLFYTVVGHHNMSFSLDLLLKSGRFLFWFYFLCSAWKVFSIRIMIQMQVVGYVNAHI